jgi:phosphotransferase system enzyme I (PtsI)
MTEVRLKGRSASPGFAAGPIAVLPSQKTARRTQGDPSAEAADLRAAMEAAAQELKDLMAKVAGEAGQILGFQLALIEDEALSEAAFASIKAGTPADVAWSEALGSEIAHYEGASDEHFRARASDLKDLRDRVLGHLSGNGAAFHFPAGGILVAEDVSPSLFLSLDWSSGGAILLSEGSPMSHVAILARAKGIPMITGFGALANGAGGEALVDGAAGEAIYHPAVETRRAFELKRSAAEHRETQAQTLVTRPATTRDGVRIFVHLNIARVSELASIDPDVCDGIGLVRTEFLFEGADRLPGEDAQYEVYRQIVHWAAGRPVTIRTLDAGGDKPIPGFTQAGESNPFLGMRGIRLSLVHRDVFRLQLRALVRAAAHGPLKIMLPMVTVPEELRDARAMLQAEIDAFVREGVAVRRPKLGIMVEVPAVALSLVDFDADFFSIGSNDLTQYATAAGRDIGAVAALADPLHPGVLKMIEAIARHGRQTGIEVSLCGDAGGDPAVLPHLIRAGLRSVSVSPAAVARVKAAIAGLDLGDGGSGLRRPGEEAPSL